MGGSMLDTMTQEEKLKRFDAIMREKFGAAWAKEPIEKRSPPEEETETKQEAGAPAKKRTPPNKAENTFMLHTLVMRNSLKRDLEACEGRLKQASPTAWRDAKLMLHLVSKIQDEMLDTMPLNRLEYYQETARTSIYRMEVRGPIQRNTLRIVTDKYLSAVIEAAMENECVMCMRTGNEVTNCLIRKCLLEQAPPTEVRGTGCEYRKAAGKLIREEEVDI